MAHSGHDFFIPVMTIWVYKEPKKVKLQNVKPGNIKPKNKLKNVKIYANTGL